MNPEKLNGKMLLEQAENGGKIYPTKDSWRKLQIFAGILTCVMIIPIPLGILIIMRARKARVGLTAEGFAFTYLTTVAYRWSDIESFTVSGMSGSMYGGGLIGAATAAAVKNKTQGLKGPLSFKIKGKRGQKMIPAHTIANSMEMAME
ncbi:MAG: hypothetical protein GY852_07870, partial [bacterium]|nr:hypothetical protein [bacterium]